MFVLVYKTITPVEEALTRFIKHGLVLIKDIAVIIVSIAGATAQETKKKTILQPRDRFCPNCGQDIPFGARVCPYCKKDFEQA
ncbi:MAG TPA: hypothetical protein DSN98_05405 [Thermoplasmata archaeon]|jgi:hypothetical protein|nr:MAG TPA: hypothetical protein DSN98_05405 [Thermoplasmata archaeon]